LLARESKAFREQRKRSFAVADGLKTGGFAADQSAAQAASRSVAWNPGLFGGSLAADWR